MKVRMVQKFFQILKLYVIPFLSYYILLLVSSLSKYFAIIVNCLLLIYISSIISKKKYSQLNVLLTAFAFNNLIVYQVLVSAYAEVLQWEEFLHFLFYMASYYFYTKYITCKSPKNGLFVFVE